MKANEFVKKFGWNQAKIHLEKMKSERWINSFFNDLKRLVEAHELVSDYYGLARAKEHAESNYTAPELRAALKQAIADVESCQ